MARARNIKPGFFKNEDLAECSPWARLCFAGLWTLADREGRLEDRPKRIKGEIFAFDSIEVEPLLSELERYGFIVRYETEGMKAIQITEFAKHQSPHYSEIKSVIKPPDNWEQPPDDDPPAPGTLPENRRIKRGSQPPDSLIPDSLNPEEEKLAAQAGARPSAEAPPEQPGLTLVGPQPKPKGPPDCPHAAVLALWAEVLPHLPQHDAAQWRGSRADHLRARWRETATTKGWTTQQHGLAYLRKLFAYVGQSPFLTGREHTQGRRPFFAELAWLVEPLNWAKVIEGKYHPMEHTA